MQQLHNIYDTRLDRFEKDLGLLEDLMKRPSSNNGFQAKKSLLDLAKKAKRSHPENYPELVESTSKVLPGVDVDKASWIDYWQEVENVVSKEVPDEKTKGGKGEKIYPQIVTDKYIDTVVDGGVSGILANLRNTLRELVDGIRKRLENVPAKLREQIMSGKKGIFKQTDPSIETYLDWYDNANLNLGGEIEEQLKVDPAERSKLVEVLHIKRLFEKGKDPYMGLEEFLKTMMEQIQEILKKVQDKPDDKSVPKDALKNFIQTETQFINGIRNTVAQDLTVSSEQTKKLTDLLRRLETQAETVNSNQVSYLQSSGNVQLIAQSESKSKDLPTPTGKSASSGTSYSSTTTPRLGDRDVSDERRQLDALMARDAPSILSRRAKPQAMQAYLDQLKRFLGKSKESGALQMEEMVLRNAEQSLKRANDDIAELKKQATQGSSSQLSGGADAETSAPSSAVDPDEVARTVREIGSKKKALMTGLIKNLKGVFDDYARTHADFALRDHRDGLRYMMYWRNISLGDEEAKKTLKEYFEKLTDLVKLVDEQTGKMRETYRRAVTGSAKDDFPELARWGDGMPSDAQEEITARLGELDDHLEDVRRDTIYLYEGNGLSIYSVITSVPFLLMYAIKLLRMLFAWAALHFSEHVFQLWYVRVAFGQNRDPPNPAYMIVLFVLIDMAMNVALLAVMYLMRTMFSTPTGTFPIDDTFIFAFVVDYACTTLAIFAIAAVVAHVVRTKKYFRYRYEGERGIRALQMMTLYVSIIVLLLPFFRLAPTRM
mgnify:CR=1 FL=1